MKSLLLGILFVINLYGSDTELLNDELVKDINKYFNIAKEYSTQGKNVLIEQTLLNGINTLVDNKKIKINSFDIKDKTNEIKINVFLEGEDTPLDIDIKKFKWEILI